MPALLDTYQNTNDGDPNGPHVGIQSNGTAANSADHTSSAHLAGPVKGSFADGNGTALSLYLDGSGTPLIAANVNLSSIFNGGIGANAFVGFTAATGSAQENSSIVSWTWQ